MTIIELDLKTRKMHFVQPSLSKSIFIIKNTWLFLHAVKSVNMLLNRVVFYKFNVTKSVEKHFQYLKNVFRCLSDQRFYVILHNTMLGTYGFLPYSETIYKSLVLTSWFLVSPGILMKLGSGCTKCAPLGDSKCF